MAVQDVGTNVRRIMKLKGYSIASLAKEMEMGTATISNILNGRSEPKSSTLLKFGEALGVKLPEILADTPKLASLRFRTHKALSSREKAERDQMLYITAKWLKDYHDLEELLSVDSSCGISELKDVSAVGKARAVREVMGLTPVQPITDLPDLIEQSGIKLLLHPFGFKKTFGLSLADKVQGAAIVVNAEKDISVERRIFTIAHELGHLLLHSGSYDDNESVEEMGSDQEKEADLFAGELLLPTEGLKKEWNKAVGLHWVDRVLKIKKMYKVSYKTVLMRLSKILPEVNDCKSIYMKFGAAYKKRCGHDLKNHYEPDALEAIDPLSDNDLMESHFASLVRKAYLAEMISMSRAAEMLGESLVEVRKRITDWVDLELNER